MLKVKHNFKIIIITIAILLIWGGNCFAVVTVTDENLNSTFQKFISSESNDSGYTALVANNIINITVDGENYEIKYDLTNKPTFSFEMPIQKGMSYSDFENETGNVLLPMLGYIVVGNIQGVEFEDSTAYFSTAFLSSALASAETAANSYTIVDDLNGEEGDSTDSNIIYTSEFGEKVMEYVNTVYEDKQTITDSSTIDGINSYVWTIERKNITDTSCTLVSSVSVNIDANFSKIKGYAQQVEDDITISTEEDDDNNEQKEETNTIDAKENTVITNNNTKKSNTTNKSTETTNKTNKDLPQTGINETLSVILMISIIILIISIIKYRKYKDLK